MLIAPNSGIVPPLAPLVGRRSAAPPSRPAPASSIAFSVSSTVRAPARQMVSDPAVIDLDHMTHHALFTRCSLVLPRRSRKSQTCERFCKLSGNSTQSAGKPKIHGHSRWLFR
jgi:hypothetical protein